MTTHTTTHELPAKEVAREVYVALGSNLAEPEENLKLAVTRLDELSEGKSLASSVWVSKPEGFSEDVPDFCNAVMKITVTIPARELLLALQTIEHEFGRTRAKGPDYESRRLDLDVIDYGGECIDEPGLTLPHPRAHERRFVLIPLREICATFRFPNRTGSLDELIELAPINEMQRSIRLNPSA